MLRRAILRWIVGIVAVAIAVWLARIVGLKLEWDPMWRIAVFVPVLALANMTIRPILKLVALPITCLTLGLFGSVINALVFWLAGSLTGAEMSFLSALFGSVVVAFVAALLDGVIGESKS